MLSKKNKIFNGLSPAEHKVFARLSSPAKIQDFLDALPMNFMESDPCLCPRQVLEKRTAHCMEGALFASAALMYHGHNPLLLDLTASSPDEDHVVTLYRENGLWGAISKTNHAVLRYREPIYKTVRELALSYFHEYFLHNGQKTLRSYSDPFDLSKHTELNWVISQDGILDLIDLMANSQHHQILNKKLVKNLRKADLIEIEAGKLVEWPKVEKHPKK